MAAIIASSQPSRRRLVAAGICALALVAVFQFEGNANHGYINTSSLFYWWGYQWVNPASETEHGPLILLLSAWLFYRNLARFGDVSGVGRAAENAGALKESVAPAALLLLGALALHALGFAAQQARVSAIALLLGVGGVVRLAGGRRWGAAAAFPLAYMIFALPFDALDSAGFWLRLWVIRASAGLAHFVGIPVLENGTQLTSASGSYHYDVAAACSGVRSLVALLALALLVAYMNFRPGLVRAALTLLAVPLIYIANVIRILLIIVAAQAGGQAWGERVHAVMGFGVFIIVLGGVLLAARVLRRRLPRAWVLEDIAAPAPANAALYPKAYTPARWRRSAAPLVGSRVLAGVIVVLAAGECVWLANVAARPGRGRAGVRLAEDGKNPAELPAYLGIEWSGEPQAVTAAEREILPPDTGYSRKLYFNHHDPSKQVFLSIVLSGRDRTSIHRPELCLIGQGWTINGSGAESFLYPGPSGGRFRGTVLRVEHDAGGPAGRGRVPQLVVYWFVGGDAVAAGYWERLGRDIWNRVVRARADRWAYILLQTNAEDGEAAALDRIRAVLRETLPDFQLVTDAT